MPWSNEYQKFPTPPEGAEGILERDSRVRIQARLISIHGHRRYVLPVLAVTSEVELARKAERQVAAVVAVGLVVARAHHVGLDFGQLLNLVVEVVEDPVIHSPVVAGIKGVDVPSLLLLEPGIGIGDITNYILQNRQRTQGQLRHGAVRVTYRAR
jgi:hypothetical protein